MGEQGWRGEGGGGEREKGGEERRGGGMKQREKGAEEEEREEGRRGGEETPVDSGVSISLMSAGERVGKIPCSPGCWDSSSFYERA